MALLWGVVPRKIRELHSPQRMVAEVTRHLLNDDLVKKEDTILYLLGSNTSPGGTNMIRIARAGDVAEELEQCETY
jgi:pyruvate kinase